MIASYIHYVSQPLNAKASFSARYINTLLLKISKVGKFEAQEIPSLLAC